MHPITSPLKPEDSGPPVANLQDALVLLQQRQALTPEGAAASITADEFAKAVQTLPAEQTEQRFGAATATLVWAFQIQQGLRPERKGAVDDITAVAINKRLEALGAFDASAARQVVCVLQAPDEAAAVEGVRVAAIAVVAGGEQVLDERRTEADGRVRLDVGPWPTGTKLALRALGDSGETVGTGQVKTPDSGPAEAALTFRGAIVEGRVVDTNGQPVADREVLVFEIDAMQTGWKTRVGQPRSQADGGYRWVFDPGALFDGDMGHSPLPGFLPVPNGSTLPAGTALPPLVPTGPDLWVTLQDRDERPPLAEIVFNAGWLTCVPDLVVPAEPTTQASELDRVFWLVQPRLDKTPVLELSAWQIAFLARDCDCPIEWVRALVLAARWRHEAMELGASGQRPLSDDEQRVLASFAFASGRESPELTLRDALARQTADNLAVLERGVALQRVPALALQGRGVLVELLEDLRRLLWFGRSVLGEPSSLGDVIEVAWPGDTGKRDRLRPHGEWLMRWRDDPQRLKPGSARRLVDDLGLDEADARRLHTMLRLDHLAGRDGRLLAWLGSLNLNADDPEPLLPLASIDRLGWANAAHWLKPTMDARFDPNLVGLQLAERIQELMPAPTLAVAVTELAPFQNRPVYGGLAARLGQVPTLDLMEATPTALSQGLGLAADTPPLQALLGLRQLKAAGLPWDDVATLLGAGISGFESVVQLGAEGLKQRLTEQPEGQIGPLAMQQLLAGATRHQATVGAAVGWLISPPLSKITAQAPTAEELDEADAWSRRLLGFDRCMPQGALDVLSPAAYMADLLKFIEVSTGSRPALDERLAVPRGLLLNRENTEIDKRVCDLAIEVLENAIALPRPLGMSPAQARQALAQQPLGTALVDALHATTDVPRDMFGPLRAEQEVHPVSPASAESFWLVRDAARHWRLRLSDGYWAPEDGSTQDNSLTAAASQQVVAALEAGNPATDLAALAPLLPLLRRLLGASRLPLGITAVLVTSRGEGPRGLKRWTLNVFAEGTAKVEPAGQFAATGRHAIFTMVPNDTAAQTGPLAVTLTAAAGGTPTSRTVLDSSGEASVREALDNGRFPASVVMSILGPGAAIEIDPPAGDAAVWRYGVNGHPITIVHQPEVCEIVSLVYQSVPELDGATDEPVHCNPLAYEAMNGNGGGFPWSLPFDEPLEHARALLQAAGLSRRELIESTFGPIQSLQSQAWALEVLGLDADQADRIRDALTGDAVWAAWGLKPAGGGNFRVYDRHARAHATGAPWIAATPPSGLPEGLLQRVSIVLQQSGLGFAELQCVLATAWVNPGGAVRIEPPDECELGKLRLVGIAQDGDFYRRLHRFVRLQRALGWPIHELNAALATTDAANWPQVLAHIKALHERLSLPVEVVASLFQDDFSDARGLRLGGDGGVEPVAPLYERIFGSPNLQADTRNRLRFDSFQPTANNGPAQTADKVGQMVPHIAAALGVRASELTALRAAGIPDLQGPSFVPTQGLRRGADGLLGLWRQVVLWRALRLDAAQYAAASRLVGTSPFRLGADTADRTAALLRWVTEVRTVVDEGISFVELEQVLHGQDGKDAAAATLDPADGVRFLSDLHAAVQALPTSSPTLPVPLPLNEASLPLQAPDDDETRWRRWGLEPDPQGGAWRVQPALAQGLEDLAGEPLDLLQRLDVMALVLGRHGGQVKALLQTLWVQEAGELKFPEPAAGEVWQASGLKAGHLDRLAAFDALSRASGLGTLELDAALDALTSLKFPPSWPDLLADLAALRALIDRTRLEPWRVVAWWSGFATQVHGIAPVEDPASRGSETWMFDLAFAASKLWTLDRNTGELAEPSEPSKLSWTAADYRRDLAQGLGVSPELLGTLDRLGMLPEAVSLAGLKEVHRWATLLTKLNLTPSRLLVLQGRFNPSGTSADPFESPRSLLAFIDLADREAPALDALIQRAAGFADLPADLTEELLLARLDSSKLTSMIGRDHAAPAYDAESVLQATEFQTLSKLRRFAWLNRHWRLQARQLAWLGSSSAEGFVGLDPQQLPRPVDPTGGAWQDWLRTSSLARFAALDAMHASTVESYREAQAAGTAAQAKGALAEAFGIEPGVVDDLAVLTGAMQSALPPHGDLDPFNLVPLLQGLNQCQRLGLSREDLRALVFDVPNGSPAAAARRVLLARRGPLSLQRALSDAAESVRKGRLTRLTDFLVWQRELGGLDDLREHFGIDVRVSTCRKNPRLLQAILSLQLSLQLALQGYERQRSGVTPEMFNARRAEWMASRVVRNANLEVLLFPWRYWLPEFDDGKSTALETCERTLGQGEATKANVELALRQYLDDVIEESRLKVIHLHLDGTASSAEKRKETLYLLARTRSSPYQFYWRCCHRYGTPAMRWTGWKKIDASIDGNWPMLFVLNGVLNVCWTQLANLGEDGGKPKYQVEVGCTRLLSGRWTERKLSEAKEFLGERGVAVENQIFTQLQVHAHGASLDLFCARSGTNFVPTRAVQLEPPSPWFYNDPSHLPPAGTRLITPPPTKTLVSIQLRCWIRHVWRDPSLGQGAPQEVHYQLAPLQGPRVRVKFQPPSGYNLASDAEADRPFMGSYFSDRHVATFRMPDKDKDPRTTGPVTVTIEYMGSSQEFVLKPIDLANSDHVCLIDVSVDVDQPPEQIRNAEALLRYESIAGAEIGEDGLPSLQPLAGPAATPRHAARLKPKANWYVLADPGPLALGGSANVGIDANSPLIGMELRQASLNTSLGKRLVWWAEREGVSALIDTTGTGLWLIPGPTWPPATLRQQAEQDLERLFGDHQANLAGRDARSSSTLALLPPAGVPAQQDPSEVTNAAFDPRFIQAADHEELFMLAPWSAASATAQQHRYDITRQLLRYVFDPTQPDPWRYQGFKTAAAQLTINQLFNALTLPARSDVRDAAEAQIEAWLESPFDPAALVRLRPREAQLAFLHAYAKNEFEQGNLHFRAHRQETLNTAKMYYANAAKVLDALPMRVGSRAAPPDPLTYRQLAARQFGASRAGAWLPATGGGGVQAGSSIATPLTADVQQLLSLTTGYFRLPNDDTIESLRRQIEEQRYKIDHCQNIDGVVTELPALDPPIDPLLLIRARRMGLTVEEALSDAYAPPSHLRFETRLALAQEIIAAALPVVNAAWTTLEEAENEHLAAMQSQYELNLLSMSNWIREKEEEEAKRNLEALKLERAAKIDEINFLARQLGGTEPALDEHGVPIVDDKLMVKLSQAFTIGAEEIPAMGLSTREREQLHWLVASNNYAWLGVSARLVAKWLHIGATLAGQGDPRHRALTSVALGFEGVSDLMGGLSSNASTWQKWNEITGGFERRHDQIKQSMRNNAQAVQVFRKRETALQVRRDIAQRAKDNQKRQIEQLGKIDEYRRHIKFSNEQNKRWAHRRAVSLAFPLYRMALEAAQQAEREYQLQVGDPSTSFVQPGAYDSRYLGRFALEALSQSLLRMKTAYLSRPPELSVTEHISLRQLDPMALLSLRYTGKCEFSITEDDLNRNQPVPLYFQRIHSLVMSMPCVVGPQVAVHAKLTVLSSAYRHSNRVMGGSVDAPENFRVSYVPRPTLLTSGAASDGGVFRLSPPAGELLPPLACAGLGQLVCSLALPEGTHAFDYSTISDVVLTIEYMARECSGELQQALSRRVGTAGPRLELQRPARVLVSARSDFSADWQRARSAGTAMSLRIEEAHLPYWLAREVRSRRVALRRILSVRATAEGLTDAELTPGSGFEANTGARIPQSTLGLPCEVQVLPPAGGSQEVEDQLLLLEFS